MTAGAPDARDARAGTGAPAKPAAATPGLWAPLRHGPFRTLFLGQFLANLGLWMHMVGAQWFLTERSGGAGLVALVQTATTLPVFLFGLLAGVAGDLVDRRRLLVTVQVALVAVSAALTVTAGLDVLGPWGLLGLTFLLGAGNALLLPTYQAVTPELVPRAEIPSAAALNGININTARTVGPALGGLVLAVAGAGWVFGTDAAVFAVAAVAVLAWRSRPEGRPRGAAERPGAAIRAGLRYVRYSRGMRQLLVRSPLFVLPASALWALLPVVAARRLGLGSVGYGLMLGSVGFGAILGAITLTPVRRRLAPNAMLAVLSAGYGTVLVLLGVTRVPAVAVAALLLAGAAWTTTLAVLNATAQLQLPGWVRARGLAMFMLVFQGGQAVGAAAWGGVADLAGIEVALVAAGVVLAAAGATALLPRWGLIDIGRIDPSPSLAWPEPQVVLDRDGTTGPVLVTVEWRVAAAEVPAFVAAMRVLARARRRTGAQSWGLFQDAADPERFLETYRVASWDEHLRQHTERWTVSDDRIQQAAKACALDEPRVSHLFAAG